MLSSTQMLALLAIGLVSDSGSVAGGEYVPIAGGRFASVLPADLKDADVVVGAFRLRTAPTTNGEYLAFVAKHPEWRRGEMASVFGDERYLEHWQSADVLGANAPPSQPVTHVSWFAAEAFCESEGARLPTWNEWEFAAAADATRADARNDAAWREWILNWYARPSTTPIADVGSTPNFYGVGDLHGLIWEWVEDFNALLVASDSRDQNDPDRLKFCGAGALNLRDRDNYAVLMRVAMLSSVKANDTTANMGFRCTKPGS